MDAILSTQDVFTISVPHIDVKRFRALVKAFGWNIEKKDVFNETTMQAIQEMDNGVCERFDTVDDYLKALG